WGPLLALIDHMHAVKFLPPGLRVDFLVTKRIDEILPMLRETARKVAEAEKAMAVPADRL
ncbi:MAG TPA: TIGR00730 family Rossman fold protein, partial [Xanthobacteraceae bacterium]|nr:TIGR00730 family Rossman fold protein [Xanthobacteraceae bacterium]